MPDTQARVPDIEFGSFTPVGEPLLYIYFPIVGHPPDSYGFCLYYENALPAVLLWLICLWV